VLALTTPYLWYTTRATGLVTLVLFTMVVSLGALVANRAGGTVVGRFEINELHRSLSVVAVAFLTIHVATTVVDSFVATGLASVIVPLTSSYKRIPIALGAVALDLLLAVWLSSLAKARLANATWRYLHWFSWLAFATSLVHAVTAGTDARRGFGLVVVVLCAGLGAGAGVWRVLARPPRAAGRTALSPPSGSPSSAAPAATSRPARPRSRELR
jgi:DMSO/TMAO reductase YedYZ heme-binding membrane subunit